jgi:prepilin-type N-terminal cleavage/methylation domain-containing protein
MRDYTFWKSARKMKKLRLSSRVRRAFQGSSRGFTLIEVVVAIGLMGIIAISVLGALSTASMALLTADQQATAESLARSQMEYVKNQIYNSTQPGGEATYEEIAPIPDGYSVCSVNRGGEIVSDVIGVPWDSENNTAVYQDNGLQKIELVIKNSGKVLNTLEGYKRNPEA